MSFDEHMCMINSYQILTGKKTYKDMLNDGSDLFLVFNPSIPLVVMDDDVYDLVRLYFEAREDYEKCAEIQWAKCKAKSS